VSPILTFFKKFELLQQDFKDLKMARYFTDTVLSTITYKANEMPSMRPYLKRKCILYEGKQWLTNAQIKKVIKEIVKPLTEVEFQDIMNVSMFDRDMYDFFEDGTMIKSNYPLYLQHCKAYVLSFEARMELIIDRTNGDLLPLELEGGTGATKDAKPKGMIQYFLDGLPNSDHAYHMWKHDMPREKRKACKDSFDDFVRGYMKHITAFGEEQRLQGNRFIIAYKPKDYKSERKKPYDYRATLKDKDYKRGEAVVGYRRKKKPFGTRLHAVEEFPDLEVEDEDQEYEEEDVFEEEQVHEDRSNARYKRITDSMLDSEAECEEAVEEKEEGQLVESKEGQQSSDWLNGMPLSTNGPAPCFKLAKFGRCEYGSSCKYSHHPDDIARYNKARDLGEETFKAVADKKMPTWYKGGNKPLSGFGASPGIKPRVTTPTSVLKKTGPVTRKQV